MFPEGVVGKVNEEEKVSGRRSRGRSFCSLSCFPCLLKKGGGQKTCLSYSGVASGKGEKVWSPQLPFAPPEPLCLLSVEANEWWINLGSPLANWDDPLQNLPEVCIPLGTTETQNLIVHAELTQLKCRHLIFKFFFFQPGNRLENTSLFRGCTRQRAIWAVTREPRRELGI